MSIVPFHKTNAVYLGLLILIAAYRLFLCFQTPISTGDIYRHLGFSSHAFESLTTFYTKIPADFAPEPWTGLGGFDRQPYIYPPVALAFFSLFSMFGLGIFWVKLVLLLVDLASALLFGKHISRIAAILLFALPQALWFSSREAQFDGLQSLLMILTTLAVWKGRWIGAGILFGLALQTKLLAVFLIPWLFYETIRQGSGIRSYLNNNGRSLAGIGISFLPFIPLYWGNPKILFAPLEHIPWKYSSYFWNPWSTTVTIAERWLPRWIFYTDNFGSLLIVISCLLLLVWAALKQKKCIAPLLPFSIFWVAVKSGHYVRSWYLTIAPAFLFPLGKKYKHIVIFFIALQFLVGLQSFDFLLGNRNGYIESPSQVALYEACMFICDFRKHSP